MSKTLFIGGLAFTTNERDLDHYFAKFGEIENIKIVKDPRTKASKGFGFIFFFDERSIERVLRKNTHVIKGRKVDCQSAKKKSEKRDYQDLLAKTRIFVTGLTPNIVNKDMEYFFRKFGRIKSAYVIRDPDSEKSLGFGFVIFEKPQDANKIIKNPNLYIKGKKVECDIYKDEGNPEKERFDPVGKRMRRLNRNGQFGHNQGGMRGNFYNGRGGKNSNRNGYGSRYHKELRNQVIKKNQNVGIQRRAKKRFKPDLFGVDEEKMRIVEKEELERHFHRIWNEDLKEFHVFGNLRLNWGGVSLFKKRKKTKKSKKKISLLDQFEMARNKKYSQQSEIEMKTKAY